MASSEDGENTKELLEQARSEIKTLADRNASLQNDLDNALSEVAVAGCVKEDLIELQRQITGLEDEKKSLESLLNEARDDETSIRTRYEHECARIRAVVDQLEVENKELRGYFKNSGGGAISDIGESGAAAAAAATNSGLVDKETLSAITDVTKSLARKVRSNLLPQSGDKNSSSSSKNEAGETSEATSAGAVMSPTSPLPPPPTGSAGEDQTGMQKAFEDAEVMRAIIIPLEEQIGALKDKLRETDGLLREMEVRQSESLYSAEILGRWLTGKVTMQEALEEIAAKGQELKNAAASTLTSEETGYLALLNARLGIVIKELSSLKSENNRNVNELERSLKKCTDLRSQAAEANGRLLRNQQQHVSELGRVASLLTEDQKLKLSQMDSTSSDGGGGDDENSEQVSSPPSRPTSLGTTAHGANSSSKISFDEVVVEKVVWDKVQSDLAKMKALLGVGLETDVVGSDQFKQVQKQLLDLKEKHENHLKKEAAVKSELKIMEDQWNERAEQYKTEVSELQDQSKQSTELLQKLQKAYHLSFEETKARLVRVTQDREKIVTELRRLQLENDELLGKHSAKAEEMQREPINLPERMDDMQLLLLTLREQVISAKVAAEHHESKKKQLHAEMSSEIESLKERLLLLESCQSEMIAVQKRSKDVEAEVRALRNDKSKLEKDLQAGSMQRAKLENSVSEFKSRVSNLQQELDNSVAVQTDFVRLSQSLQMELEKIRQSEKEVRWQHEEDVDSCSSCRNKFSGVKRKHHCRHCGRIFCNDCLSKTVASGPQQRPSKVCEVCHTLLVQNSAPYFSTAAPQIAT